MMEVYRAMSKDLTKSAAELERMAENKASAIRQVVREYNETAAVAGDLDMVERMRRQRELERAVQRDRRATRR